MCNSHLDMFRYVGILLWVTVHSASSEVSVGWNVREGHGGPDRRATMSMSSATDQARRSEGESVFNSSGTRRKADVASHHRPCRSSHAMQAALHLLVHRLFPGERVAAQKLLPAAAVDVVGVVVVTVRSGPAGRGEAQVVKLVVVSIIFAELVLQAEYHVAPVDVGSSASCGRSCITGRRGLLPGVTLRGYGVHRYCKCDEPRINYFQLRNIDEDYASTSDELHSLICRWDTLISRDDNPSFFH